MIGLWELTVDLCACPAVQTLAHGAAPTLRNLNVSLSYGAPECGERGAAARDAFGHSFKTQNHPSDAAIYVTPGS